MVRTPQQANVEKAAIENQVVIPHPGLGGPNTIIHYTSKSVASSYLSPHHPPLILPLAVNTVALSS